MYIVTMIIGPFLSLLRGREHLHQLKTFIEPRNERFGINTDRGEHPRASTSSQADLKPAAAELVATPTLGYTSESIGTLSTLRPTWKPRHRPATGIKDSARGVRL